MYEDLESTYNSNIFFVNPRSFIIPVALDRQENTLYQESFKVYNIGQVNVHVELVECLSDVNWQAVGEELILTPGQTIIFDQPEHFMYVSAVRIINKNKKKRAIVHCVQVGGYYPSIVLKEPSVFNKEYHKIFKETFAVGVKFVPYVSKKLQGIYDAFWPRNKYSVWEEILGNVKALMLDPTLLKSFIMIFRNSMCDIQMKIEKISKKPFEKEAVSYINLWAIQADLSDCRKKLTYEGTDSEVTNMLLLPLYSNFVMLELVFIDIGLQFFDVFGFPENVPRMKVIREMDELIQQARWHIDKVFKECLRHIYNTYPVEDLYDAVMGARSYYAIHGLDFMIRWQHINNGYTYMPKEIISYSNYFGRMTPKLLREAFNKEMRIPLTANHHGETHNYLTSIIIYLWWDPSEPKRKKIGGMRLTFLSGVSIVMGTKSNLSYKMRLGNKSQIVKLDVTGKGAIDSIYFYLSDGREFAFGTEEDDSDKESFCLDGHLISSIFISSDSEFLGGQAANIAVTYVSIKEDKPY